MALIHCDFFSDVLGLSTSMTVILPQNTTNQIGLAGKASSNKHKTLLLLHGMSDDHTIWLRRTSIERYVSPLSLAVVMPAVHRSYYTDMKRGGNYWTFISEELPAIARSFFPLSDARDDNFVAGLSMGGYGAFKLALRCPDRFAAAASLSGALDVVSLAKSLNRVEEFENTFGPLDQIAGSENDLLHQSSQLAKSSNPIPRLFQCCGTEDFLYQDNLNFRDHLNKLKIPLTCIENPGSHEWGYWDQMIQPVLKWMLENPE